MKLISVSLKLNKLEFEALENISCILNININNIKTKGEIIKLIIEFIQNLDNPKLLNLKILKYKYR